MRKGEGDQHTWEDSAAHRKTKEEQLKTGLSLGIKGSLEMSGVQWVFETESNQEDSNPDFFARLKARSEQWHMLLG